MSSIVTGILNLTFGLLWDKLRDNTAERLQDGDVTDEKCRQIVIRELDNVNKHLEGLSRKDLLASISFIKEGVCLLNVAFRPARNDVERCELQEDEEVVAKGEMSVYGRELRSEQNPMNESFSDLEAIDIEKLSRKITNLNTVSKDRLSRARTAFEHAQCQATIAFNNKALPAKDRILACKLRVISRILEDVEDPVAVVETCKLYLSELHNIESIQEIFSVHILGGLKARFNKQKRQVLMSSVIMISYVLVNFTLHFAKDHYDMLNWPQIKLNHGTSFHPLLDPAANAIMRCAKIGAPHTFVFDRMDFPEVKQPERNKEEIMVTGNGDIGEIIITDGKMHLCLYRSLEEISTDSPRMLLVGISGDDEMVYVVAYVETSADKFDLSLLVADKTGENTRESKLEFLSVAEGKYRESATADEIELLSNRPSHVEFAVSLTAKPKTFIIGHQTFIYVCDSNGVLLYCFETAGRNDLVYLMKITDNIDVLTASYLSNRVSVYSMDGSMKHQFDLVSRGHVICDVVSHHTTKMIYVLTRNNKEEFQLEIYTHLGEYRGNLALVGFNYTALSVLLEGPVAVIYDKGFILV